MFLLGFLKRAPTSRTWNTPWSMPPSSRSTATAKAQKGDSEPGHRALERGMTTKILALTDALGNLVRFKLLPGHRYDTIGIKPLLEGVSFDARSEEHTSELQ